MNNRRSYGYQKKQIYSYQNGATIEHREKEKGYRIFLKIKYNLKKFSKMEKVIKRTIAFTLKAICKIIVLIIKFPQILKCSTKQNYRKLYISLHK